MEAQDDWGYYEYFEAAAQQAADNDDPDAAAYYGELATEARTSKTTALNSANSTSASLNNEGEIFYVTTEYNLYGPGAEPLVLSTNGQGINLIPLGGSQAHFDFTGSGTALHTGWIGANTGLLAYDPNETGLVANGLQLFGTDFNGKSYASGLAALASLDSNHDGVIDANDAAWTHLGVWVDPNGTGVAQAGDFESLASLGIVSISLNGTPTQIDVGGNLISETATVTFADGTTETIDDVTFNAVATDAVNLFADSPESLAFYQQVLNGSPSQAEGDVAAAMAASATFKNALTAADTTVSFDLTNFTSKPSINGVSLTGPYVYLITPGGTNLTAYSAPTQVRQAAQSVFLALSQLTTSASDTSTAAANQVYSENAAVTANLEGAAIGTTDDVTATNLAMSTELSWQTAFADLLTANADIASATSSFNTAQGGASQIVLTSGWVYGSTEDAQEAADTLKEQELNGQGVTGASLELQNLLSAAATAWNVSSATLVPGGSSLTTAGGDLLIIGSGNESITGGTKPTKFAILQGANVQITNFIVGPGGSVLDFMQGNTLPASNGNTAIISQLANGNTQIVVGSSIVTLVGVTPASLSLYSNFAGVDSSAFAWTGNMTETLAPASGDYIDDGTSHLENLSVSGGSNTLTGDARANDLDAGGSGTNVLIGGGGQDTYNFDANWSATGGTTTIVNGLSSNPLPTGNLQMGIGPNGVGLLNPSDLWLTQSGNDLLIQVLGTTVSVTVQGWFANTYSQLSSLTLGDASWIDNVQINTLATAMTAYQVANPSFSAQTATSIPTSSASLNTALAVGWARSINASEGYDTDSGVYGNNTYQAATGDILTGGTGQNIYDLPAASGSQTTIADFKIGAAGDTLVLPSGDNVSATNLVKGDLLLPTVNASAFEVITSTGATTQFSGPGSGFTLVATGNFLGNGHSDAMWVNASGQLDLMAATGTGFVNDGVVGSVPTGATYLATADFNDDGKADILWGVVGGTTETLWESASNASGTWTTSQVTYNGATATVTVGASAVRYSLLSTSDQNDDGKADLLWQVTTSAGVGLATWTMNGTTISGEGYETNSAGTIVDGTTTTGHYALTSGQVFTGDFNGDGKMDYLFYTASTGQLQLALAGTGVAGADTQPNVGYSLGANAWTLLATPDINGDGKSDILWESLTATNNMYSVAAWEMNGGTQTATPTLGSINATTHLLGAVDLNGDGKADLVWQDSASNQVSIWWGGLEAGATTFYPGISLTGASVGSFLDTLQLTYGSGSSVSLAGVSGGASLSFAGTSGNDLFDEGAQSSYTTIFEGEGGSDTYKFGLGYQSETIVNGVLTNVGPSGNLLFGAGIGPSNLWFSEASNGADLVIQIMGTTSQITVQGWFTNSYSQLASLTLSDGSSISAAQINALEAAMAAYQAANTSFNPQTATSVPGSSSLLAGALAIGWARTLNETAGNLTVGGIYGNNTYLAGSGDILTGGPGQNTFDLPSTTGIQTITDFKIGAAGDALSLPSGDSVTAAAVIKGDLLVANSGGFEVISSTGATEQFAGPGSGYTLAATGNFLSNGHSAAMWVNASGQLDLMAATGTGFINEGVVGSGVPTGATVLATADFNGDGEADILWGVVSGTTEALWESASNGTGSWTTSQVMYNGVVATVTVGASAASYSLLSTLDQNGDGKADLLWKVTTSAGFGLAAWTMSGATATAEGYVINSAGTVLDGTTATGHSALSGWQVLTGDFNGDGKMDYLFYSAANGAADVSLASTGTVGTDLPASTATTIPANTWSTLTTADVNGDGKTDILWKQLTATGGLYTIDAWLMNGGTYETGSGIVGSVNATTQLLGAVDLNGDGKADLVWQDSATDQVSIWWSGLEAGETTFNPGTLLTGARIGSFLDTLQLTYGSGSSVSLAEVGSGASLSFAGTSGNDTFDEGMQSSYNTIFAGEGGSDTYKFGLGYHSETIVNGVSRNAGPTGTLLFGAGIGPSNLWFSEASNGADLVIEILGTTSQITVQGWFTNSYSQLASLTLSDGSSITTSQIQALALAMSAYQTANPSFNPSAAGTVMPSTSPSLAPVLATGWARAINDTESNLSAGGVYGNDTYMVGALDLYSSGYLAGYEDPLTGGPGQNTFELPVGNGDNSVITDFKAGANGDTVVLPSGGNVYYADILPGDLLISTGSNGFEVVTGSRGATREFTGPSGYTMVAAGNFLGSFQNNTHGSVMFENTTTGVIDLMVATGAGFTDLGTVGSGVPTGATELATADFNGDGEADILWGVVSGTTETLWESVSNGSGNWTTSQLMYHSVAATVTVGASAASYSVFSTSDQNGDGKADLLWKVTTSAGFGLATWTMNGPTVTAEGYVLNSSGTVFDGTTATGHSDLAGYQVVTGDFNGDGKMDYIFYSAAAGDVYVSLANTGAVGVDLPASTTTAVTANTWKILATPDLNEDHRSDILWESLNATSGQYQINDWLMNGGTYSSAGVLGTINATTKFIGASDLENDGQTDIIWQDSATDQVSIWWNDLQANATTFNPGVALTGASIGSFLDTLLLFYSSSNLVAYSALTGVASGSNLNIEGTSGNETFDQETQTSYAPIYIGDGGNDTYKFGLGYESETIVNGVSTNAGPTGNIQLGAGITPANLWFSRSGNNLVVQILGTTSQITIENWFVAGDSYSQLASLRLSDGSSITTSQIQVLALAMTAYQTANPSFNPQTASSIPGSSSLLSSALATGWARSLNETAGSLTVSGIYGNDTYIAGSSDILTGGPGLNTYALPSASGSQATVTDFKVGAAGDTLALPSGTNVTAVAVVQGDLLVANVSGFEVITSTGATEQFAGPGTGYMLAATGNFLGNGHSDAMWVNASGQLDLMAATGTGFVNDGVVGSAVPAGATVLATADFNGDGQADILWGVVSGTTETLWESVSNGSGSWTTSQVTYNGAAVTVASNYSLLSTADQNGDHKADLLWKVTTGAGLGLATWTMNGATVSATGYATNSAGVIVDGTTATGHAALTNNQVFTSDFNGDGKMDYLFFNTTGGAVQIALANSGTAGADLYANVLTSIAANTWSILATPDLNGDGKSDIVFKRVTATGGLYVIADWLMNGGTYETGGGTLGSIDATTQLLGAVDLNGDGKADLVWQDSATDQVSIWWGGLQSSATTFNPGLLLSGAAIGSFLDTLQLTYGSGSSVSLVGVPTGSGINFLYDFGLSNSSETIVTPPSTNIYPTGMLQLGAGIGPSNLWFTQSGANLLIQILGTTKTITIQGFYGSAATQLGLILSDGSSVSAAQVNLIEAADYEYQLANPSFNPLTATSVPSALATVSPSWTDAGWSRTINDSQGNVIGNGVFGNDTFIVGPGDVLTGGSGQNTYELPAAPGSQTTITNYNVGTAGVLDSGDTIALPVGTSLIGTSEIQGDLLLSNSSGFEVITPTGDTVQFAGPVGYTFVSAGAFLGAGSSALLWENPTSGQLDIVASTGAGFVDQGVVGSGLPTGARYLATGNFSGTGDADVLWEVANGSSSENLWITVRSGSGSWTTSQLMYQGSAVTVASNYVLLSTSSQRGNGTGDLLWQVPTSSGYGLATWTMDGTQVWDEGYLTTSAGNVLNGGVSSAAIASGSQVLTGDFNGDGQMDYLVYNATTGSAQVELANAWAPASGDVLGAVQGYNLLPNAWQALATADINGDGKSDIIWKATSATSGLYQIVAWLMNGTTETSSMTLGNVDSTSQLLGAVDLNGDGKADLIWQDTATNQVSIWWGGSQATATSFNPGALLTGASIGSFLDSLQITYGSNSTSSTVSLTGISNGTAINYAVSGTAGADILSNASIGSGTLIGNGGADTYNYTAMEGGSVSSFGNAVTIVNGTSSSSVPAGTLDLVNGTVGAGIPQPPIIEDSTNLWFSQSGNDLLIQILGQADTIRIQGWYGDEANNYAAINSSQLASLTLPDGSQIGTSAITALAQAMGAYQSANPTFAVQNATQMPNDPTLQAALQTDWARTITGTTGDDMLNMGVGNNTVIGGGSVNWGSNPPVDVLLSDEYEFSNDSGRDTIINSLPSASGPSGSLSFTASSVGPDNLWFEQSGNNLVVDVLGTSQSVTVSNWFKDIATTSWEQLEHIVAGGYTIDNTTSNGLNTLIQAMATYDTNYQTANGTAFDPTATANATISDQTVLAAVNSTWHH